MTEIDYLNFDLQIEREGEGYRARVLDSPAGQASNDFVLPFSDLELENFVLRMSRTRRGVRRLGSPELEAARAFGGQLFEAVFAGEVRGCLRSSLDAASGEQHGLRLRVRLSDAPDLVDLPWEYLYSAALNRFFSLSNTTPVIRYLDLPERIPPLAVQPPLRLLAMIAGPRDYPPLDVEQEWGKLHSALQALEEAGLVILERLQPATLGALQRRLRQGACHILHFVGHGAFDEAAQDGVLLLEDEQGRGRAVSAQDLGVLLHDHPSLRLVMLNSCEGARTSRLDPFAGSAQSLVQQGIPAVVAMQFEISDEVAIVIAHEFYTALAAGYPVDAALAEARKAAFTGGNSAEWGIPVLYLRSADGRIFGVTPPPQPAVPAQAMPAEPSKSAPVQQAALRTAVDRPAGPTRAARRWALPLAGLLAILALVFGLVRFLPDILPTPAAGLREGENGAAAPAIAASVRATDDTLIPTPTAAVAMSSTGQTLDKLLLSEPRVLSNTAWNHELIPAADGVWAASSGGLVRWQADGTSTVFTAVDGLPFNHTRALLPMPDGTFWAAGDYAAAHIPLAGDGLGEVRIYAEPDGLPLGQNPTFMLDGDGSVWIASSYTSQPIYRFDGAIWRPVELPSDDPVLQDLALEITSMLRGEDGALWLGLSGDGILRLDEGTWTHYGTEQGVPEESIGRLLEDRSGVLWAAAGEGGLLRFAPEMGRWQRVELQRPDAPIFSIAQLPDDSLWASGDDFIVRSTDGGRQWAPVATGDDDLTDPTAVVQDESGRVWVAASNGVGMYDDGHWRRWQRAGELADSNLGQLIEDPDGQLWVLPAYGGPPSVVDPTTGQAEGVAGLTEIDVRALAFTGDATWAGTSDGLLRLKGGSQRLLTSADGLPADQVTTLLATPGTLWIGTVGGLAGYDLRTEQITGTVEALAGHGVDVMLQAPDGALWVGSHWGDDGSQTALDRFAGAEHRRWSIGELPFGADPQWVRALAADDDGGIWVSLSNGVQRWDGRAWTEWAGAEGAPTNDIFAFLTHVSAMWAAGDSSSGIYGWNSQDGWQRLRALAATGVIAAMRLTRDGTLWLATNDGLLRYGP